MLRGREDDPVLPRLEHLGLHPPDRCGATAAVPAGAALAGVLRRELGDGFGIVEEGLNGRTTVWDDLGHFEAARRSSCPAS